MKSNQLIIEHRKLSIGYSIPGVQFSNWCNQKHSHNVIPYIMQTGSNDNDIISRVLRGEQALYADLVKRYQNFVFTIALRYTPNREDAEEIAQDVFVKAYRNLADFRGESKFSTWLYTIATTTSITFLRKKKLTIHSLDNEQVFEAADSQNSTFRANQIEQKSKVQVINAAIKLLRREHNCKILAFG